MIDEKMKIAFESFALKFTPEYMEKLSKDSYKEDREYPENFSNWYPHIIDFGKFNHAKIISNQIFTWKETEQLRESEVLDKVDFDKLNLILKPTLDKMEDYTVYSLKNGCFSNKFEFNTSIVTKHNLAEQLWKINYASAMYDTGGYTELVLREYIDYDSHKIPTIYAGMPLREEVRVFYDMDSKQIKYIVDYWDYDYCSPNMRTKTDKIIFDFFHKETSHKTKLDMVEKRIRKNIDTLKFDGSLKGIWSIDFLYEEESDEIYLIDMARGFRSAYWRGDHK